jgi:hypothetical protein
MESGDDEKKNQKRMKNIQMSEKYCKRKTSRTQLKHCFDKTFFDITTPHNII